MNNEIWKPIEGTDGRYEVSNTGKVRNLDYHNKGEVKEIAQRISNNGRVLVTMFIRGKRGDYSVHRLVGKAFIPNPDNLPQINHIDGNPKNNNVENLEWCDAFYNMQHAYRTGLMENARKAAKITVRHLVEKSKEKMIPITVIDMNTAKYHKFDGINQAAIHLGLNCPDIVQVLSGRYHSTRGYAIVRGHEVDESNVIAIIEKVKSEIEEGYNKQTRSIIAQRGKSVISIDSNGNRQWHETIIEASRVTGVARVSIRRVADGIQEKSKGYRFEYAQGGDANA